MQNVGAIKDAAAVWISNYFLSQDKVALGEFSCALVANMFCTDAVHNR
jgi:hypothetical protein